jgi:hypothetical protein
MTLINAGLLKSPWSWANIFIMVLIAGIAFHLIADSFGVNPSKPDDSQQ